MTDPEFADATYVEPITPDVVASIIAKERPDALLPTLGGQTALTTAVALHETGVLAEYGVELIGANIEAIHLAEDREKFKGVVARCGAESARSEICHTMDEVLAAVEDLGYPLVVRPSFTMGGLGSGIAYDETDLRQIAGAGLHYSPTTEVLLEESILGWKEYELELMRDRADNVVVVCSIENVDPVGVHTGDSITVAPSLTLTDREYQRMRDVGIAIIRAVGVDTGGCNIQYAADPRTGPIVALALNPDRLAPAAHAVVVCTSANVAPVGVHTGASTTAAPPLTLTDREYQRMRDVGIAIIRAVGVDTGGCNIQYAVDPRTGRIVVIEMNPRVSRSSAPASKASGVPIAKSAAKLALG